VQLQHDGANVATSDSVSTSLVDLLMRWGNLLSTLAHGSLEVAFGPQAALPVPVAAEPIERILVNLACNARAATSEGGMIRIGVGVRERTRPNGKGSGRAQTGVTMVLTVDDSGCGMSKVQVQEILGGDAEVISPQTPVESAGYGRWQMEGIPGSTPVGRRRGLGLQIVRELVAASGGSFFVQSKPGAGTRIEIHWPTLSEESRAGERVVKEADTEKITGHTKSLGIKSLKTKGLEMTARSGPRLQGAARELAEDLSPVQLVPGAKGPDGFSEEQLWEMMRRMHRRDAGDRGSHGSGVGASGVASVEGCPSRNEPERIRPETEIRNNLGKGTIAC
jgi:hypothetical protein